MCPSWLWAGSPGNHLVLRMVAWQHPVVHHSSSSCKQGTRLLLRTWPLLTLAAYQTWQQHLQEMTAVAMAAIAAAAASCTNSLAAAAHLKGSTSSLCPCWHYLLSHLCTEANPPWLQQQGMCPCAHLALLPAASIAVLSQGPSRMLTSHPAQQRHHNKMTRPACCSSTSLAPGAAARAQTAQVKSPRPRSWHRATSAQACRKKQHTKQQHTTRKQLTAWV